MNENIVELLNILENSYKKNMLEGLLEAEEYFENSNYYEVYQEFKEKTKALLMKMKVAAMRNESFEALDTIQELLDNCK